MALRLPVIGLSTIAILSACGGGGPNAGGSDVVQPPPTVSFESDFSVGNEGTTVVVKLDLSFASSRDVTVNLLIGSNATVGADFSQPVLPIQIPAGSASADLAIDIIADDEAEIGETITLSIVSPCTNCVISAERNTHSIELDDWRGTVHASTNSASGFHLTAVAANADSALIVGGHGGDNYNGYQFESDDGFLANFDLRGELVWFTKILPLLPAGRQGVRVNDIFVDSGGTVFVVGTSTIIGENKSVFVAKFDSGGVGQWGIVYGGPEEDIPTSIAVDTSGNAYIAGRTSNVLGEPPAGSCDLFVAKFDPSGILQWSRQVGGHFCGDGHSALAVTASDRILVAGLMVSPVDGVPIPGDGAVVILSLDRDGNESGRTFIEADVREAIALPTGGAVIAGGADELVAGKVGGPYIAMISDAGVVEWIAQETGSGSSVEGIAISPSGSIILAGWTTEDWTGEGNSGRQDAWVLAFDAAGSKLWSQQFGGSEEDRATGIGIDRNGNSYIGAWSRGDLLGFALPFERHSLIVKLDDEGLIR